MSKQTIAAIATPLGESSIGVIRISGDDAVAVADRVFFPFSGGALANLSGYSARYGEIKDGDKVLDDAVALVFKAPKSYTGEDVVEISVHGGRIILVEALRLILNNGAVAAEPGEFTKRAFLNGKMDLTKAESIMGLISARSESQLKLSRAAHLGKISDKINRIIELLVGAGASIAAFSDYPDEDIEGLDYDNFLKMLEGVKTELEQMLSNYDAGKVLREGIDTVIIGKPNVGKSTLMNLLSGAQRSIVTEIAGTTRDVVEDTVTVAGITLRLADTAGIRETDDKVESIGVDLAKQRAENAQLVLAVFDATDNADENDIKIINSLSVANTVIIINKTDVDKKIDSSLFSGFKTVEISAKNGSGYDKLEEAILSVSVTADLDPDDAVLINERQRSCSVNALDAVNEAINALVCGNTMDAVGVCVDDALSELYALTGKRVTNEVTDEIFRRFCVGK